MIILCVESTLFVFVFLTEWSVLKICFSHIPVVYEYPARAPEVADHSLAGARRAQLSGNHKSPGELRAWKCVVSGNRTVVA